MSPKEYLLQIKHMDLVITALIEQKDAMRAQLESLTSPQYDGLSVQKTATVDKIGESLAKIDEKERRICQEIDRLADAKAAITQEIADIEDTRYVEILLRRYVSMEKLEDIAKAMSYTYDHLRHLHGLALLEFDRLHPQIRTQ